MAVFRISDETAVLLKLILWSSPVVVFVTPVISWSLEKVNKENLLGKIKVTIARSLPDQ